MPVNLSTLKASTKKALEITVRNSMDEIEALAYYFAFKSSANCYEVISIELFDHTSLPVPKNTVSVKTSAVIIDVPRPRSQDIVSYLIQRELRLRCA